MENDHTVLIVEDEKAIRHLLSVALKKLGYNVIEGSTSKELFEILSTQHVDLLLLDLFLDDDHGIEICKKVREKTNIPMIVISSMGGELNQVIGLNSGADMYLEKPFSIPILLASMHALFRRVYIDGVSNLGKNTKDLKKVGQDIKMLASHAEDHLSLNRENILKSDSNYSIKLSNWLFIPHLSCLKNDSGRNVKLTKKEMALLQLFIQHQNQILSRQEVARALKIDLATDSSRVVDVQVSRLRAKLKDKNNHNLIKSIRNKGYILNGSVRMRDDYNKKIG